MRASQCQGCALRTHHCPTPDASCEAQGLNLVVPCVCGGGCCKVYERDSPFCLAVHLLEGFCLPDAKEVPGWLQY